MEEQAGIYRFTLYENKDISLIYQDKNTITNISNSGAVVTVENSDCSTLDLGYSFTHRRSGNNLIQYKNTIDWTIIGLSDGNIDLISQLKSSIYGWIVLIEFYNTSKKIITNPFIFDSAEIDNNASNSYNISLMNSIFGDRIKDYSFVPLDGIGVWIIEDTFIIQ